MNDKEYLDLMENVPASEVGEAAIHDGKVALAELLGAP